jgi:hypothetical protein
VTFAGRRVVGAVAFIALAGCNSVFGIERTKPLPDAPPPADRDEDGVADAVDNCIDVANSDQGDVDDDRVGDVCDNCPLVANRSQEATGDSDPVGDACDAHPDVGTDCLVVFERFHDPAAFAQNWQVITTSATPPAVDVTAGAVTVTPADALAVALVERNLTGLVDTELLARATITRGEIYAASNVTVAGTGFQCGIQYSSAVDTLRIAVRRADAGASATSVRAMSDEPVDDRVYLRLAAPPTPQDSIRCVADHGLAIGTHRLIGSGANGNPAPTAGAPGAVLFDQPATFTTFALYRTQSAPCAPVLYR